MHATTIYTADGWHVCDCATDGKSHNGWPPPTRAECIGSDGYEALVCGPGGDLCGNL